MRTTPDRSRGRDNSPSNKPGAIQTAATAKIAAVVSDPDGATPWAEFTVKRGTTVVFKGLSTSGSGTTQSVDVLNLPKGSYTVSARAYDGRSYSSNSTPSTSFSVTSDPASILGDTLTPVTSTHVESLTLPAGVLDETGQMAGSAQTIAIGGVAGVPDDEQTGHAAILSMSTSGWSSSGGVSVFNPDGGLPLSANFDFASSMRASTAVTSTSIVDLSEDGEVTILNTSANPVNVVISVEGWYGMAEASVDPPVGPQPDPDTISGPPTAGSTELTFTPPVDETYALAATTDNRVGMTVGGTLLGHFSPNAIDDNGETVPATIGAVGSNLVLTVNPLAGTAYPITVVPTFEATNPSSSKVQALYPEPEEMPSDVSPTDENAPALLTETEVVQAVDDGAAELIEDLKNPEDAAYADDTTGEVTTFSASTKKVPIPNKWGYYGPIKQKFYYYDPKGTSPKRQAWKKGWHDYCTDSNDTGTFNGQKATHGIPQTPLKMTATWRGPCARHDLCIEFKQAPTRTYCDKKIKADMRQNCRYALTKVSYYAWVEDNLRSECYSRASKYYAAVTAWTAGRWQGAWGHDGPTSYPDYRYDKW